MASPESKDVVQEGLDFLIDFWKDKPKVQGLLKSQLREIQEIEDVAFQLLNERNVTDAVGAQLDVIGNLVGEQREGREDEPYRQAILLRISINRSDGTPPVILDILNLISGSPIPNLFEHFPASFHAYVDRGASHNLARTLKEVSAAGVDTRLIFDDNANSFIGARSIPEEVLMQLESDAFEVDSEINYLAVEGDRIFPFGNRSVLSHSKEVAEGIIKNPMAKTINETAYVIERNVFQLEEDSILEIDEGFILQFVDLTEVI
jgi:hypothetical protein